MIKSNPPEPAAEPASESPELAQDLEALLLHLKQSRGFDFTAYKRATLMRRVLVRMQTVGMRPMAGCNGPLRVGSTW